MCLHQSPSSLAPQLARRLYRRLLEVCPRWRTTKPICLAVLHYHGILCHVLTPFILVPSAPIHCTYTRSLARNHPPRPVHLVRAFGRALNLLSSQYPRFPPTIIFQGITRAVLSGSLMGVANSLLLPHVDVEAAETPWLVNMPAELSNLLGTWQDAICSMLKV